MKRPNPDALRLAAEWLNENEGDSDEQLPMLRVATWLRELARKDEEAAFVKEAVKQGIPKKAAQLKARELWREQKGTV